MSFEFESKRILVTGIADFAGSELLRQLELSERVEHAAGLDFREPRYAFKRAEVINADLRAPGLKHLIEGIRPDTVVHLLQLSSPRDAASGDGEAHEINVIGTINLVAAVQAMPFVRKFVLMSALHVYGGDPLDAAVLTEDTRPRLPARSPYAGDLHEIEATVNQLARSGRSMILTCLRVADIIGPKVNNSISRYLTMPLVPTILGFDPRLQFCHETDVVGALKRAALLTLPGLYNVVGDGVAYLSRILRLGRRLQLPVASPFVGLVFDALRTVGVTDIQPHHLLMLRYGRAVENRRLKARFGYTPRYSTVEAVLDLYNKAPAKPALTDESETVPARRVAAA